MKWKVFLASATGKHHLASNVPCQDSGHYLVADNVLIGVVCDGAGSASQGQAGAEYFANKVAELLAESIKAGHLTQEGPADYRIPLTGIIQEVRSQLNEIAVSQGRALRDFACTLVGCVTSGQGGCFFHIGDGFAVYMKDDGESVLSLPENGEHSDETYFVTDENWSDHLRVTELAEIGRGGVLGLMTDGTSPFAINRPKTGFYRPFIDPIVKFLRNATEETGSHALKNVLADEKTFEITSDDKTLLLALAS